MSNQGFNQEFKEREQNKKLAEKKKADEKKVKDKLEKEQTKKAEAEAKKIAKCERIDVYSKKTGNFIRAYSRKQHGKDFVKLADMFSVKKNCSKKYIS